MPSILYTIQIYSPTLLNVNVYAPSVRFVVLYLAPTHVAFVSLLLFVKKNQNVMLPSMGIVPVPVVWLKVVLLKSITNC